MYSLVASEEAHNYVQSGMLYRVYVRASLNPARLFQLPGSHMSNRRIISFN
jgi:hypothetical protein